MQPYNAAVDLLERNLAAGRADRIAYIDDREQVTFAALVERADRAGSVLRGLGVDVEQRVLMVMHDTVDFVAVFLGAMKIGAVPVPVNTLLQAGDYAAMLTGSRARVLVVSDVLLPKLRDARDASPWLRATVVARSPAGGPDDGHPRLEQLLAAASPALTASPTTADDAAFWLYSSGSTGAPKGVVHLHAHLLRTAELYARGVLGLRVDDRVFSAAKLFFAYGLGNALTFPLAVGATTVLLADRPTPAAVFDRLARHGCSVFCGVPTLFAAMLADPAHADVRLPALRVCTSAGEALPRQVGERWQARFACEILDGIGSTEMLHIFLSNAPGAVRYGTSGTPVPGYNLKLVDDDDVPVADGEEGSLWVRGPTAAAAYFGRREASLQTFHGPWTRTGDRYVRDADGYYTHCGRADDMLKVGGIWVSPVEVESALVAHDAVLEAAVVAHHDDDQLIKPKAFVVLKDASKASPELVAELKLFIKQMLAPYKYPRWIEFVESLPRTATGKLQRFRLRG
jgi:benzoate-CoA ligase